MAVSSTSSSSTNTEKHDVFLSFAFEDTGNNFTSHLTNSLHRKQIETIINHAFKTGDDDDEISPSHKQAIQDSSLTIIVFSEKYASSTWCLNEVVEIVECWKTKGQIVVPVFYHVTPSEVRKQNGKYEKAFDEYETRFQNKVGKWKEALTHVANLSGWDLDRHDDDG